MRTRRLFIALPLPETVRRALAAEGRALPARCFRPLKEENLHVTLVFLGDTPDAALGAVEEAMRDAAGAFVRGAGAPIAACVGGLGAFPGPGEPRVVWAGLARGAVEAGELSGALRVRLRRAGVRFDGKPFAAHITIAYARRDPGPAGTREAGEAFTEALRRRGAGGPRPMEAGSFDIGEMVLLESLLRPGGSEFIPVCRVPLGAQRNP